MLPEFTGERVVPGKVDGDLWNEHIARYAFAGRLALQKRVLDAGCGTGYGMVELAPAAQFATGLDISAEAVLYARGHYRFPNVSFVQGSCIRMPFREHSFDLVVAFEVLEHLKEWPSFLKEIRRVLHPSGQVIISTPNARFYGLEREAIGPNPYHEHEFTFEEFSRELLTVFPHVCFFVQNHVEGFVIKPLKSPTAIDARVDKDIVVAEEAHFFIAVCALAPQTGSPAFIFLPRSGNVLNERRLHIEKLNEEIRTKDKWIAQQAEEHQRLLEMFRRQLQEIEEKNHWAEQLDAQINQARTRIVELQQEMEAQQQGYETKIAELEAENREIGRLLKLEVEDKLNCLNVLHQAERSVEERTQWALRLQEQLDELQVQLSRFRASRWVKLGKALGIGPKDKSY